MDLTVLFSNLVGLFLLIGVGFGAVRLGWLPASAAKAMSALLMKVTLPATIFASMMRPFDPSFLRDAAAIFLVGAVLFPLFSILSVPLSRLFRVPEGRRGMWRCCATFCNNSFMGFPVALALFGEEGLALTVILSIPFNLLVYTVGAKMVCQDRPKGGDDRPLALRSVLFSVINLSILVSLIVYLAQLPVPSAILAPIQHLSNVTTPLSMLVTGMNLAQGRAADVIRDRDALTASAVRLLLFPVLAWALLTVVPGLSSLVVGAALINLAMPSPAAATFMGEQYNGCTQLGARIVFLSSLLCIVTIPLISLLL